MTISFQPESSAAEKKVTSSNFLLPQDVCSRQSSGTSIWVLQVSVSHQKECLPARKSIYPSLF